MLTVTDYARKLLHENDCVVVPELGGFIAHFNHAHFNSQTGVYHAPHKRVAFNEALKLDDGLLVHYLVVNEQISRDDAMARVKQFVENIRQNIQENKAYLLDGIGTLSTNFEGKLQFEPLANNFYGDSFGFDAIDIENVAIDKPIEETDTEEVWQNGYNNESPFAVTRHRKSKKAFWYGAASIAVTGALVWGGMSGFSSGNFQSSLNPANAISTVQLYFAKINEAKAIKKIEPKAYKIITPAPSIATPTPVADAPKTTTTPTLPEAKPEPKKEVESTKTEATPTILVNDATINYYIVAASFANKDNAQKLEQKLKARGYTDAFIMNPDAPQGELFRVNAIGLENSRQAKKHLKSISRIAGTQACIINN